MTKPDLRHGERARDSAEMEPSQRQSLIHFPLEFRGGYRSQELSEYLERSVFLVHPVQCIDFITSSNIVDFYTDAVGAWLVYGRRLTDPEIAASLSHRAAWRVALESNCEWAVFYEDDVRPHSSELERFLGEVGATHTCQPTLINLSPAQTFGWAERKRRALLGRLDGPTAVPVASYTTNAQAYAINRAGLRVLSAYDHLPVVRPPDYPPPITHLRHFAVNRGQLFDVVTVGGTTVGHRGEIPMASRVARWGLRMTALTYMVERRHYGGLSNYWRYEVTQRLEHWAWRWTERPAVAAISRRLKGAALK